VPPFSDASPSTLDPLASAFNRSPNAKRLAAVTTDRVVQMFDDSGAKRDKFSTKPAQSDGPKNFVVRGMAFSPCSTKLAIGQSDNIVFVYKLGIEWGDKKSICNKFLQHHPVTALAWPAGRAGELAFATADGKVRVGTLKTNKASTLYAHPEQSYVVALASSPDGNGVCSGHLDGSVYVFSFSSGTATRLTTHPCAPYGLAWGVAPATSDATTNTGGGVIACAGADKKLVFYDSRGEGGRAKQTFDHGADDPDAREFSCAAFCADGETLAVGSFDAFFVYAVDPRRRVFRLVTKKHVPNLYTVSALAWRKDGSQLALGALRGNVDVYDACVRRRRLTTRRSGESYDVAFTSHAAFVVRRLRDDAKCILRSKGGLEIAEDSVAIKRDRYVVARTHKTVLLADLETGLVSEAPSLSTTSEKAPSFDFDADERSCVVRDASAGELAVIEYGIDGYIGTARASSVAPELVSLRVNAPRADGGGGAKKIAYPLDAQTLRVDRLRGDDGDVFSDDGDDSDRVPLGSRTNAQNRVAGVGVTVTHASRVDWLELNARATHLLFRDKKRRLFLVHLGSSSTKTSLLEHVTYAQWVPGADVIVAQANSQHLCVWYSLDAPEKVSHVSVVGDVESIERADGVTNVTLVDETRDGTKKSSVVTLDESLVAFNTLLEEGSLNAAAEALEPSFKNHGGVTAETEPMWRELLEKAVAKDDAATARRCAAALGDVARADFLDDGLLDQGEDFLFVDQDKENDSKNDSESSTNDSDSLLQKSKLAMLDRRFGDAESLLFSRGRVASAVSMWRCLGRLDNASEVARRAGRDEHAEQLGREHLEWLKSTGQEETAGALLEARGDLFGAIRLFLKGGVPGRAAAVVIRDAKNASSVTKPSVSLDSRLIEEIVDQLKRASLHSKAGLLFDALGKVDEALRFYVAGDAFAEAVDLTKRSYTRSGGAGLGGSPSVEELLEKWGDFLMRKGGKANAKEASHRYVEAGHVAKAFDAALEAGEAEDATRILDERRETKEIASSAKIPSDLASLYLRLAKHHERVGSFDAAESCYLTAGEPLSAVEMHARNDRWDAARRVAEKSGDESAVAETYARRGKALEARLLFSDAETAYLAANKYDLAIAMYEKHRLFDHQLRLIGQRHGADALKTARSKLATALAEEGNLKEAEKRFAENGDWKLAVKMYRDAGAWEEAVRAARAGGGGAASKQVAYAWARSLDDDAGAALLKKFGLLESGVEHFCECGDFEHALLLAKHGGFKNGQIKEVYLKRALFLEDEGKYAEAEKAFIEADKPKEAIDMFVHAEDWASAARVAETHAPELLPETLCANAEFLLKKLNANDEKPVERQTLTETERSTLTDAERLFIRAKRPDRAIDAYRDRNAWDDVLRVAKDYAPRRLVELENERRDAVSSGTKGGSSVGETNKDKTSSTESSARESRFRKLLEKATNLEASGDYSSAVDAYLEIDRKAFGASPSAEEKTKMTRAWRAAVKLAGERVPGKTRAVVSETAYRIRKLGDAAAADDLLAVHGVSPAEARERYVPNVGGAGASGAVAISKPDFRRHRYGRRGVFGGGRASSRRARLSLRRRRDRRVDARVASEGPAGGRRALRRLRGDCVFGVGVCAGGRKRVRKRRNDAFAAVVNTESYLAKLVDSMRATPDVHADALRAFRDLREAARLTRVSFSASNPEKKDVDGLRFVAAKGVDESASSGVASPRGRGVFPRGRLVPRRRRLQLGVRVPEPIPGHRRFHRRRRGRELRRNVPLAAREFREDAEEPGQRRLRQHGRSETRASVPAFGARRGREEKRGG
jgi:intraflagellar transport protein 172